MSGYGRARATSNRVARCRRAAINNLSDVGTFHAILKGFFMLTVGDRFPHFVVDACVGLGKDGFKRISNDTYKNKWVCYFFYPKDFTFVCPTELVEFGKKLKEFKDRDCELVTGSTDNEFSHQAWRNAHADLKDLPYP